MVKSFDDITQEWADDSIIDETDVGPQLLNNAKLHSKYVKYMVENSVLSKKKLIEYNKLRSIKWDYYNGTMSKEELEERGWKPYLYSVKLKDGIERCLDKDDDINKLLMSKALNDESVNACTVILKELNNRTWALRAWIDYQKYLLGK